MPTSCRCTVVRGSLRSPALLLATTIVLAGAPASSPAEPSGPNPNGCDVVLSFTEHLVDDPLEGAGTLALDVDRDGDIDLLRTGWNANDGNGGFGAWTDLGAADFDVSVTADLDGDGKFDLVGGAAVPEGAAIAWRQQRNAVADFGPVRILLGGFSGFQISNILYHAADFDDDGDVDLLLGTKQGSFGHSEIDVLLLDNDGSGVLTVRSIADSTLLDGFEAAAAADLNGDGIPDLIGYEGDDLGWRPATGGGSFFGDFTVIAVDLGEHDHRFVASDLDGDGDIDIVTAQRSFDTVGWIENLNEAGTFAPEAVLAQYQRSILWVTPFDGDGDGDLDLAATTFWETSGCIPLGFCTGIELSENLGTSFTLPSLEYAGQSTEFSLPAVAAFRPDGEAELFVEHDKYFSQESDPLEDILIFENRTDDCNANGVVDSCELTPADDCNSNEVPDDCELAVAARDCDESGVLDSCELAIGLLEDCTGNGVPDVCEPDCNSNGVADSCDVDAATSPDVDADGVPDECQPDCNDNSQPDGLDIASGGSGDCDLDGVPDECQPDCDTDGVPDACQTSLGFTEHSIEAGPGDDVEKLLLVDLDGDLDADLVSLDASGALVWYENLDGAGTFAAFEQVTTLSVDDVVATDVDEDGTLDLVAAGIQGIGIRWYTKTPAGFEETVVHSGPVRNVVAGDVDGDGDEDLVVRQGNDLEWLRKVGGSFGPPVLAVDSPGTILAMVAADLDLDGKDEVAVGSTDGAKWYDYLGALDWATNVIQETTNDIFGLAAVDLDGDGDPDLAVASTEDAALFRFENLGSSGVVQREILFRPAGEASAADFDGDGLPDLLAPVLGSVAGFQLIHNRLSGTFFPDIRVEATAAEAGALMAGDVDGDGDPDAVVGFRSPRSLAWFENQRDDCNGNGIPDSCEADCNGNGKPDECDVLSGSAIDCDANGVPDECDVGCTDCDIDADGCLDALDSAPTDASTCSDVDVDGCDDCGSGTFDPLNDGTDADGDGFCAVSDCADDFGGAWLEPSDVTLTLEQKAVPTLLGWDAPAVPGALVPRYDTLRSNDAASFFEPAICLEAEGLDRFSDDPEVPSAGETFFYLVRVENGCPGDGAMGRDSAGIPRSGRSCP